MNVKILRQQFPTSESYWETFFYDGPSDNSVAGLLEYLNYNDDITDITGKKTRRIAWDCSCLQGMCGACAMVINGIPALACETFLKDLKGNEIILRPLQKFPVIRDLVVDRSSIQENLKQSNIYIEDYRVSEDQGNKSREREHLHQYTAAKCLKCGLCLEVCPNYVDGSSFFGAIFANDCYLVYARNPEKEGQIKDHYARHFGSGCSKALSCMEVCPMKIPTLASMARLNRL